MELPSHPHVLIYLTPWCPYCRRALELLRSKGVEFATFDVSGDSVARRWLYQLSGQQTVPQIFIGGRSIGGYDDMHALDRRGELDPLLAQAEAP